MNSTYENLYAYHLHQKYYQDTSNVFIVIIFFIVTVIFIIFIFINYFYCWSTPFLTRPEGSLSSASSCCLPLLTTPWLLKPQANLSLSSSCFPMLTTPFLLKLCTTFLGPSFALKLLETLSSSHKYTPSMLVLNTHCIHQAQ